MQPLCSFAQMPDESVVIARELRRLERRNLARLNLDNLAITLNTMHKMYPGVALSDEGYVGAYDVDLEEITSAAALLNTLWHLNEKLFFTPQMQADFLSEFRRGFREVFGCDTRHRHLWRWPTVKQWQRKRNARRS